jgi:hypothetical protein
MMTIVEVEVAVVVAVYVTLVGGPLGHFGRVHVVLPFPCLHVEVHAWWREHDCRCRRALEGRRDEVIGIVLLRLLRRRFRWPLMGVVWWLLLLLMLLLLL